MEIHKKIIKGVTVLSIQGDLTFNNLQKSKKILAEYIEEVKTSYKSAGMILDLKDVNFVDSSGIGFLCGKHLSLKKAEKQLILCRLGQKVMQIFNSLKLNEVFEMYQDVQDGVEALKSPDFSPEIVQLKQI